MRQTYTTTPSRLGYIGLPVVACCCASLIAARLQAAPGGRAAAQPALHPAHFQPEACAVFSCAGCDAQQSFNRRRHRGQQLTCRSSRTRWRDLGPLSRAIGGCSSRQLLSWVVSLPCCVATCRRHAELSSCVGSANACSEGALLPAQPPWRAVPAGSGHFRAVRALCERRGLGERDNV